MHTAQQNKMRKGRSSINDLVLFALFNLENSKKEASFKNLLKECFSNFPKSFCLRSQAKWPDSRKPDTALRKLRLVKLIKGSPQAGFSLTKDGRERAQEVAKALSQKKLL